MPPTSRYTQKFSEVVGGERCVIMGCMKTCTKCGITKPDNDFRVNGKMSDGLHSYCKTCSNRATELSRRKDREAYRARDRAKYARKMQKLRGEGYVVGNPENRARDVDPEFVKLKLNTRKTTRRAIARGLLTKAPCQVCGVDEVEAHHPDYHQPLQVVWLCKAHHKEVHSNRFAVA